jgi:hypothetical protein
MESICRLNPDYSRYLRANMIGYRLSHIQQQQEEMIPFVRPMMDVMRAEGRSFIHDYFPIFNVIHWVLRAS